MQHVLEGRVASLVEERKSVSRGRADDFMLLKVVSSMKWMLRGKKGKDQSQLPQLMRGE